jgi:hypothetical protein
VPQVRARSLGANLGPFWQARYYDRNVRDHDEFTVKLRYLHRNPVSGDWPPNRMTGSGAATAITLCGRPEWSRWNPNGRRRIVNRKLAEGPERIFLRPG